MNTNHKGNIALGKAIAYFTEQMYTVSLPLNDSQWYDLIVERDGKFYTVQVKYTSETKITKKGVSYMCSLQTTSGTTRKSLYSVVDTKVDFIFCCCSNFDMYLIPKDKITNKTYIHLGNHLPTSEYLIS